VQSGGVNFGQGNQITILGNVIGTQIQQVIDPAQLPPALHQVRPARADFTGREALLDEISAAIDGGARMIGLFGMGGVGKTELACKLVERLDARYPDAQIFLDLHGTEARALTREEILAHMIRSFHPLADLPEGVEALQASSRSVLHGRRTVLLLDNAREAGQVSGIDLPTGCLLLLTSRQRIYLPGLMAFDLGSLSSAEAQAMARRIAPRIANQAAELARLCGNLPLALRVSASTVQQRRDLRVGDFLQRLEEVENRLKLTGVEACLRLSLDLCPGDLQSFWARLGVFPADFDSQAAAVVWELDEAEGREALSDLALNSLVEYEAAGDRYRLHELARLVADQRCSPADREVSQRRHAAYYLEELREARVIFLDGPEAAGTGLHRFELEWENIRAGQAWAAGRADQDRAAAEMCKEYPAVGGSLLELRRPARQLISWLEAAVKVCQSLNDQHTEAEYRGWLGMALAAVGEEKQAIENAKTAWAMLRRLGEWQAAWKWYGSLGNIWLDRGEPEKAIFLFEMALEAAREVEDRQMEGLWLANLGIALARKGDYRQAIEHLEQALEIARQSDSSRDQIVCLGNLGSVYLYLEEYAKASRYLNQALEIAQQVGDQRGEADQLANLGLALRAQGQIGSAREAWSRAREIFQEIEDPAAEQVERWLLANPG
jgi:tetratricopeptide (TPR) repeat protein